MTIGTEMEGQKKGESDTCVNKLSVLLLKMLGTY
jgi:hypothetical protein